MTSCYVVTPTFYEWDPNTDATGLKGWIPIYIAATTTNMFKLLIALTQELTDRYLYHHQTRRIIFVHVENVKITCLPKLGSRNFQNFE